METVESCGTASFGRVRLTWENVNAALPEVNSTFNKNEMLKKVILKNGKLDIIETTYHLRYSVRQVYHVTYATQAYMLGPTQLWYSGWFFFVCPSYMRKISVLTEAKRCRRDVRSSADGQSA